MLIPTVDSAPLRMVELMRPYTVAERGSWNRKQIRLSNGHVLGMRATLPVLPIGGAEQMPRTSLPSALPSLAATPFSNVNQKLCIMFTLQHEQHGEMHGTVHV